MIAIMSNSLTAELSKLAEREQKLVADDVLFRVGDPILSLFLVASGELRLTRSLPHGFELTLQRAGAGAVLAEASLFAENYHCEAVATEASVLRVVPRRQLQAALTSDSDLARALIRHLAQEVQRTRTVAEILSLKTVAQRIEAWIVLNDGILPPKGHWRGLASEIGITPEALYRELAKRRSSPLAGSD
ncbi:Crp/Fnr family transcriptional regulator [Mesorhizobium cantuariense]|uniref:Crp/Fnr family transcriptional regulator n=1 Tax=Mesorhizobium cantuariense TaxID=1300275 RepID=A0ABV7MV02_9HYPH